MVKPTLAAADSKHPDEEYDDGDDYDEEYIPHVHIRLTRGDVTVEVSASVEFDTVTATALKLFEQIEPKT